MRIILLGFISISLLACSQKSFEVQDFADRNIASVDSLNSMASKAYLECEFISPAGLSSILKNQLGISSGDIEIGKTTAGAPILKIASNLSALGQGNLTQGKADDNTCTTTKFKLTAELFIDACTELLTNTEAKNRLFPQGARDTEQIYMTLIGRLPTEGERQILIQLEESLPVEGKEAGVCAAVASSMEALIRI